MRHWVYLFKASNANEGKGTMHLAEFDAYHKALFAKEEPKTLCGQGTTDMTEIDETASGYLATCKTCRRVAGIT